MKTKDKNSYKAETRKAQTPFEEGSGRLNQLLTIQFLQGNYLWLHPDRLPRPKKRMLSTRRTWVLKSCSKQYSNGICQVLHGEALCAAHCLLRKSNLRLYPESPFLCARQRTDRFSYISLFQNHIMRWRALI